MPRFLTGLTEAHDWRLVVLAGVVCILASAATVNLFRRARASRQRKHAALGLTWPLVAGTAAGVGIWATHIIAALGHLPASADNFRLGGAAASLLVAAAATAVGFAVAVRPGSRFILIGGTILAAGSATSHEFALVALSLPGIPDWSNGFAPAGLLAGIVLAMSAMAIAAYAARLPARLAAVGLLASGLLLTHAAASAPSGDFAHLADIAVVPLPAIIALMIAGAALAVIGMAFVGANLDQRLSAQAGDFARVVDQFSQVRRYLLARAEKKAREQNLLLDTALNNMSQGLCMFDAAARLVVVNDRYIQLYGLDPARVQPGRTLRELLEQRLAAGTFSGDPARYVDDLLNTISKGENWQNTVTLADGRTIVISNRPMAGGGWVATHDDITDRRRASDELDRTRAFLHAVIEHNPAMLIVKEARDLRYILLNRAAEDLHGVSRNDLIGKHAREVFEQREAAIIDARDRDALADPSQVLVDEHAMRSISRGMCVVITKRLAICDAAGTPEYLLNVVEDVTERKRAEARIAHMAHYDALTDLPNRATFNDHLVATLEQACGTGDSFALFCIDLDRFKEVNDVFGHSVGDSVLRDVANRLRAATAGSFLARLGGDEFTVISAAGAQPATAEAIADRLQAAIEEEFDCDGRKIQIGLSIGVAIYPTDGADPTALLANADAALYRAKAGGRGSIRFFEAEMDRTLRERRVLQHELRSAIERRELVLYYQPQARTNGEVVGMEALVRWQHPTRGLVSPGLFVPIAEESGLITTIGEWILRDACREAASWSNKLHIAINLSPIQFRRGDLVGLIHRVLLDTGLAPHRLELEITEGVLIDDYSRALSILRRLKALGVRIAMDDFGTGYSSLSYLNAFPFDKIKIDRSFIAGIEKNYQSAAIVRSVIGLVRGLNLPVIAEGVENEGQFAFLAREGCDEVQGYLIGRPGPIEHYADLVGRDGALPPAQTQAPPSVTPRRRARRPRTGTR